MIRAFKAIIFSSGRHRNIDYWQECIPLLHSTRGQAPSFSSMGLWRYGSHAKNTIADENLSDTTDLLLKF